MAKAIRNANEESRLIAAETPISSTVAISFNETTYLQLGGIRKLEKTLTHSMCTQNPAFNKAVTTQKFVPCIFMPTLVYVYIMNQKKNL